MKNYGHWGQNVHGVCFNFVGLPIGKLLGEIVRRETWDYGTNLMAL